MCKVDPVTHSIVEPDTPEREVKTMAMLAQVMNHMFGDDEEQSSDNIAERNRIATWFAAKYQNIGKTTEQDVKGETNLFKDG